jgi:hypothetical protein
MEFKISDVLPVVKTDEYFEFNGNEDNFKEGLCIPTSVFVPENKEILIKTHLSNIKIGGGNGKKAQELRTSIYVDEKTYNIDNIFVDTRGETTEFIIDELLEKQKKELMRVLFENV